MKTAALLAAAAAFALGSCEAVPPAPPYASGTVSVAAKAPFGSYLVGPNGMTLYILEGTYGTSGAARCSGECLRVWPPLLASAPPLAGPGVDPARFTIVPGAAGPQVAYSGWPLYYYARDRVPGDTTGQHVTDAWGMWHLVAPSGQPIRPAGH